MNINGVEFQGGSISITKGRVIVDGRDVTPDSKTINISVAGDVETIHADDLTTLTVNGNCGKVNTMSGDVDVDGDVKGNISTMSGDVVCRNVSGSVHTMSGDIGHN